MIQGKEFRFGKFFWIGVLFTLFQIQVLAQPVNDLCSNRTNIGSLPTPGACVGGVQDGAPVVINGTTINANPEYPYQYVSGNCVGSPTGTSSPANDVWYSFTSTGTTINFDISGLPRANVAVYQGGTCGAFTYVRGCMQANNAGNGSFTISPVQVGITFFIQVSSDDTSSSSDGNFTLTIDNDIDCDNCYRNGNLTASPAPVGGTYNPGQVVTFCFEVTHWEQMNANWFHGVQITMGAGWTGAITNPVPAATCQNIPGPGSDGTWDFYPAGIGIVNGTTWGPGFYFRDPFSLTTNLSYGDDCSGSNVSWTFCWDLTVNPTCDPNSDLSVTVNTSGDGESGGWTSVACLFDVPNTFNASGIPAPTAIASSNAPICMGNQLELYADTVTGATYAWTGPNGYTSNVQNPIRSVTTPLDSGRYILAVTKDGCTGYDTINVAYNGNVLINPTSNSPVCEGDTLKLFSDTIPSATYSWVGPGAYVSNSQNPERLNSSTAYSGRYYISVTSGLCSSIDSVDVIVNTIPIAIANATTPLCEGDTLDLTANTIAGATYSWTGPNGFTSNIQNPSINTVIIANAGDYYLEVSLNGCTGYDTVSVIINPIPTAIANATTPLCDGDTLDLTANTVAGATYSWTGPNGFTSNMQNPSVNNVSVLDAGDYFLEVTLNGCIGYDTVSVIINPIPPAIANATSPLCEGDTINLTANTIAGATYSWTGSNGFTSNVQNPSINTITLANAGDYYLEVTLNGCTGYDTVSVTINPVPTAIANATTPLCEGDTLDLTANTVAGATYFWTGPSGFTSNLQNPSINTVTVSMSGDYYLAITLNGCTGYDTVSVVINPLPIAVANGNTPLCEGDTLNLTANTSAGASYSWSGPNGFSSNLQNPSINTITIAGSGDYYLEVTANGCTEYDTVTISINPVPTAIANGNTPLCEGDTINLTANTVAGATYAWTGPNGFTSAQQNPSINTVTTAMSGDYILEITLNGCFGYDTVNIIVNPTPTVNSNSNSPLCEGDTLNLTVNTTAGATYSWIGPLGFNSNIQNPSINGVLIPNTGNYIVNVNLNGCINSDTTSVVVYPIPASNAGGNGPLCEGDTINLTANNVIGATYSWTGPNGFNSNLQNPSINTVTTIMSGDYILEVSLNGCSSFDTVNITVNPIPTAIANGNTPLCEGDTLNLTANTVPGATYSWSGPNGFNSNLQNPAINTVSLANAGDYYLEVTLNGCIGYDTINIVINTYPSALASGNTPLCDGDTIYLTASTVVGATYSWTGPNSFSSNLQNPQINNATTLDSGDYILSVTTNGCTSYDTVHISIFPIPTTLAASNSPLCIGDTLNLSTTTVVGATYTWTGPSGFNSNLQNPTINTVSLTNVGDYYLEVTNNGCTGYDTINVVINTYPTTNASSNSPLCDGDTLFLTSNTNVGGIYSWTGPNGFTSGLQNPQINNVTTLDSGDYYLSITTNGCTSYDSIHTSIFPIPNAVANGNTPLCEGDTLNLTASSVTGATYSWTGPNGFTSGLQNPIINGVLVANSGSYYLEVTKDGCSGYDTIDIIVYAYPTATAYVNSPLCEGDPLNIIANIVPGGANYQWYGPNGFNSNAQSQSIPNVTLSDSGYYYLEVEQNGCTSYDTALLTVYPIPATIASSNSSVCEGDTIKLFADTVPGAIYSWTGPNGFNSAIQNPQLLNSTLIQSGDYYLEVTLNGCTGYDTVNVTVNSYPAVNATVNTPLCDGDTIFLNTTNVTGGTYSWTGPNSFSSNLQSPQVNNATTIDSGDYYLEVSLNGCTSYDTTHTSIFPIPSAVANGTTPLCEGDTINLTANTVPGATYQWTGPNGFNSNLQNPSINIVLVANSGDYYLEVTLDGCSGYDTVNVIVNTYPNAIATSTSPLCDGDNLLLTSNSIAGAAYQWTAANGFTSNLQNPTIVGATTLDSGDYYLQLTLNGCTSYDTTHTSIFPIPATTANSNSPLCENDTLRLTANTLAGATYSWTGPNGFSSALQNPSINTVSLINAGDYYLETTVNGCTGYDTISVVINPNPLVSANANSPLCNGSTLNLTTNTVAGGTYSWTGPNGFNANTQNPSIPLVTWANSGDYYLEVTANGCTSYDTVSVLVDTNFTIYGFGGGNFCAGDTLFLSSTVVPGATYQWTGPNGFTSAISNPSIYNLQPVHSGDYIITITGNGCLDRDTVSIIVNPIPTAIANSNSPICVSDSLFLTATSNIGTSFSWSGPNGFTSNLQNPFIANTTQAMSGNYYLEVTANGCTNYDTIIVVIDPPVSATINPAGPFCINAGIQTITAVNPGGTWSGNGITNANTGTFDPNTAGAGNHSITYISTGGCPDTQTIVITVYDVQTPQVSIIPSEGCSPLQVNFTHDIIGATDCKWFIDNAAASDLCGGFNHTFIDAGCYDIRLELKDANGCSTSVNLADTVCVYPIPVADFSFTNEKITVMNTTVDFFNTSVNNNQNLWSFLGIDTSSLIDPTNTFPDAPGTYQVCLEITSLQGCMDTICKEIEIHDVPYLYVPNAFTPNGDGYNDVFKPVLSQTAFENYEFMIFNRWGDLIYSTTEINDGWDGRHNNSDATDDVYVWRIKLKEQDNIEIKSYVGHFNLVR